MDNIIDGSQICWYKSHGTADASTLGFPPGHFPERFSVHRRLMDQIVKFVHVAAHETHHLYTSCGLPQPVTIIIFND